MARPRKVVASKEPEVELTDKKDILDVIAEVIQVSCGVPGCTAKWHRTEAQMIMNRLRDHGLLREGE